MLSAIFISSLVSPPASHSAVLISPEKALLKIFREAEAFDKKETDLSPEQIAEIEKAADILFENSHLPRVMMFTARKGPEILGYAFEDTVMGKWGPIHYLLGLDPAGTVLQVVILDYQEIRGRPIAKRRFLRQYEGKSLREPVRLRRDIDGVTGATISSRSLTDGIRKLLFVFEKIPKNAIY